jgi:hypothetical protein
MRSGKMNISDENRSKFAVTVDIDWACEAAIEIALIYFEARDIPVTIYTTHDSEIIRAKIRSLEVGLHPYFSLDSSHGSHIEETVASVLGLPHNLKSYRCHKFTLSNEIQLAMKRVGMLCSSNICTNLELINPFLNRFDTLEFPIYMEDGGFLYNKHPLIITSLLRGHMMSEGLKTIVIHPMHLILNTPFWDYMANLKGKINRLKWINLTISDLETLKFKGRGIANFLDEYFEELHRLKITFVTIGSQMKMKLNKKDLL